MTEPSSPAARSPSVPAAIGALAFCAFVIGSTEYVVPGVLPEIASGVHVSITTAGLLVSGYALGVVVGAPVVTALVVGRQRKAVLLSLLGFSVAGNVVSALAGSYGTLLGGRLVASLCHGAFFGIASLVAADLVGPGRRARAIAGMFMGITLANLVGVPVGTYIGQHWGWRATFSAIAVCGAVSALGVALLVPVQTQVRRQNLRQELQAFGNPQVWLALAMTAFGFGAVYCPLTYVVPLVTEAAGFARSDVSLLLALFGAGFTLGNIAGARAADRALMGSLQIVLAGLVVTLAALVVTSHDQVGAAVMLFLVGFFAYATVPGFTARVISMAGPGGAVLASSAAVAAFNLGNAAGAYLGGIAIRVGHGPSATGWMGAGMAAVGLGTALVAGRLEHRPVAPTGGPTSAPARPRPR